MSAGLFDPFMLGGLRLPNRVVMPPMTRARAAAGEVPTRLMDSIGVAYLHIAEADWDDAPPMAAAFKEALRLVYGGAMIYAGH